jgi:glyoxylase-like metal-dependent hydrolase (beta-lactamase superfamily II)
MRHTASALIAATLLLSTAAPALSQGNDPILPERATRVSEHVYAVVGWPNVVIVVGERGTLVMDTGMGPRNGATVSRVVKTVAKGPLLYLATTHYHPEHASGEPGFPPGTILVRNAVQQEEMRADGQAFMDRFSARNAQWKELMAGVTLRSPDILFDRELTLDLGGGVTVRLMSFGPGHTRGDLLGFVQPDAALLSADIVETKLVPGMPNERSSFKGWLQTLDAVEQLGPRFVLPDHGVLGDASMIQERRAFMQEVRDTTLPLKAQRVPVEDAAKRVTDLLRPKYSDWPNVENIANLVRRIYAEY